MGITVDREVFNDTKVLLLPLVLGILNFGHGFSTEIIHIARGLHMAQNSSICGSTVSSLMELIHD